VTRFPGGSSKEGADFLHDIPADFKQIVKAARERRSALFAGEDTDVYRLINGEGDGIPGLFVDMYSGFGVAWDTDPGPCPLLSPKACETVIKICGLDGLYVKGSPRKGFHPGRDRPDSPVMGAAAPDDLFVRESGMRLIARLNEGARTGVYPDQRENRALLSPHLPGTRVLNTFSYTGAFSVSAALSGAAETVSVDLSKRCLDWSRRNFELNGYGMEHHLHVKADVLDYLGLAQKKGLVFDVIILDPVTFSTSKKGMFSARKDWPRLLGSALRVLERNGLLALSCNTRTLSGKELRSFVKDAGSAQGRSIHIEAERGLPRDFPVPSGRSGMRYLDFVLARCG